MNKISKVMLPLAAVSGIALGGLVFLTAPGAMFKSQRKTFKGKNYAHRGLHKRSKKIPENSLAAFDAAASYGYGIELDVQLSKDGQVVVFHDDTLNRVCGVDARVDEVDYEDLKNMHLCGTDQTIPLFTDVLKCIRGRSCLIVELKNGKRNTELCKKTYDILKKYSGDFCIESFNPFIVRWFRRNAPEIVRGQLACPPADYGDEVSPVAAFFLGNTLLNFLGRPQFIAYKIEPKPFPVRLAESMGAMKFCWTSHEWVNEKENDAVIFEFYKPKLTFKHKKRLI